MERLRARIEPVSEATPTYRTPGVSGSSGAMSDLTRSEGGARQTFRSDKRPRSRGRNLEKNQADGRRRTFDGMFDTNPLGHDSVYLRVDISRHISYSSSRCADLSLQDGRRVNKDDFAFWFWINGKLPGAISLPETN